ncbi:hypothetical protein F2Q70_00028239 [Brassica cretica]|uniref:Uncharacterized protein n=1 Tax=Brassica cretica TaxID=69181 RepID=A0A8S9IIG3_BRACR|nr:hypothetical protein F2Q68_00027802 [Brassica cretica]KAF2604602.1 hypothetical protein F2Q70_00028239 [Brassica cretica]
MTSNNRSITRSITCKDNLETLPQRVPRQDKLTALGCASQTTDPPEGSITSQTTRSNQASVSRLLREPKKGQPLMLKR